MTAQRKPAGTTVGTPETPRKLTRSERKRAAEEAAAKARLAYDAEVSKRLAASRERLWEDMSDDAQAKAIEEHKKFLEQVGEAFSNHSFKLYETKYFLFFTDMPPQQVKFYVGYLDEMYDLLAKSFGIERGKNIWRGKAVVLAFAQRDTFLRFETLFMKNPSASDAQGLHHGFSNGNVVISIDRGDSPTFFAKVMVHETAHGFLHRYRSSVHIPSWINEGVADWIAAAVVKSDNSVRRRQTEAVGRLRMSGGMLGAEFFQGSIEAWQYGVASSLTEYMVRGDARKYRDFITGIKEGQTWQESLESSFQAKPAELLTGYAKLIGLPGLR